MTNPAKSFLPYSLPDIGEEEIEAVVQTMKSGWLTTGPVVKDFEQYFQSYIGHKVEAIAVNSATAGLHLALEALGIGEGDEVIAPSLTFTATVEVIRYLGGDPVIVDVDPVTLTIDPESVSNAITPRTKAIMVVHYAGIACQMESIFSIAKKYGLKIIEDAAHALPTTWQNQLIGSLDSDVTVFSFYANKTMTTGEGGMAVTKNSKLATRMRLMRLHGINRDAFDRFTSSLPSWYYEIVAPGYKYNLTDLAAAIGLQQLKKLEHFHAQRNKLAFKYHKELNSLPVILPAWPSKDDKHAWHLYVIRLTEHRRFSRDEVIKELSARGIGTSVHYVPLHRQPYWRDRYGLKPERFPVADAAYHAMISLPLYTKMTLSDQDSVISALRDILL